MTTRTPSPNCRAVLALACAVCSAADSVADDVYDALAAGERKKAVAAQWVQELSNETGDVAPLLLPPRESIPRGAEVIPPPATKPESASRGQSRSAIDPSEVTALLSRGLIGVSIDAAPAPDVAKQSEKIKEENQIRDLAAERFNAGSRFVSPQMISPAAACWGFAWAAPALYHRPLLFEQPNVERYGHQAILCPGDRDTQSVVSGAHFFGSVAVLPYLLGAHGCCEPEYVLGSYRPGSCNPHQIVKPRRSCRGLAAQTAATTGLVFVVP